MAVSRSLRYQILRRDNHTCRYCGRSAPEVKLTVDHVVPETLGGSDDPSNLTTACAECNGGKSATPADASHVAQVADDAQRWAEAQAVVAERMLSQRNLRTSVHEAFDVAWRNAGSFPRPTTWIRSVDTFIATGLPLQVLIDCVEEATSTRKVAAGDMFRYMCGIVWSRIRTMREQVAEVAAGSTKPAEADLYARVLSLEQWEKDRLEVPAYEMGQADMAQEILAMFTDDEINAFLDSTKEEEDEGDQSRYGRWVARAATEGASVTHAQLRTLTAAADYLLSSYPDHVRAVLTGAAEAEIEDRTDSPADEFGTRYWSLRLVGDKLRQQYATPPITPADPF